MDYKLLFKASNQGLIGLVIAATVITGGIVVYGIFSVRKSWSNCFI